MTILNYLGIVVTSAMAVLSLFFKFTVDVDQTSRKRLTRPGKVAFAITILSIATTIGSTVFKDIKDRQDKANAKMEQSRLLKEVKLGSQVIDRVEIQCEFDEDIDWESDAYLSRELSETISGTWNGTSYEFADWRMTKLHNPIPQYSGRDVLYAETRPQVIKEFIQQDQPSLASKLPSKLSFVSGEESIKGYTPPAAIYLDYGTAREQSTVSFRIEGKKLSFIIEPNKQYSQLLGSTIELAYRFTSPGYVQSGPSIIDRLPSRRTYIEDHLVSAKVFLNKQYIADLFARNGQLQIKIGTSEWDLDHNEFYGELGSVKITRDLMLAKFDTDLPLQ